MLAFFFFLIAIPKEGKGEKGRWEREKVMQEADIVKEEIKASIWVDSHKSL